MTLILQDAVLDSQLLVDATDSARAMSERSVLDGQVPVGFDCGRNERHDAEDSKSEFSHGSDIGPWEK